MKPTHILGLLILFTGLIAGLVAVRQQQMPGKRAAGAETFPCTGPVCPRAAVDVCGIPNFEWTIGNALARSGQPVNSSSNSNNVWQCLKNQGFTAIINQRASEGTYTDTAEKNAVQTVGMAYIGAYRIIDDTAYSPAMLQTMMADVVTRLRQGERVLVHDAGGRGRMGFWEETFLLWDGWTSRNAIDRFIAFGWKIGCADGGNGQMQGINEIAVALGQPTYYPLSDSYGTTWQNCPRPSYMNGWNYATISWSSGRGGLWSTTGVIPGVAGQAPTPSATPTRTPTPTQTVTPTPSATRTPTLTPTATPSPSSGPSATPTRTPTPTATRTPTPTATHTPTPTRTPTPSPTSTPSPSSGPSASPTPPAASPTGGWTTGEKYQLLVGDVNDDNTITILDIGAVLLKYTDFSVPVPPGTPEDVNADGAITIEDVALVLLNYVDFTVPGENP